MNEALQRSLRRTVAILVVGGASFDDCDAEPEGPGWAVFHHVCAQGRLDHAARLAAAGAWLEVRTRREQTPLHEAARAGRYELVLALVRAGAQRDARDADGASPLHLAAGAGKLHTCMVLLLAGADPEAHCYDGSTPADHSTRGGFRQTASAIVTFDPVSQTATRRLGDIAAHEATGAAAAREAAAAAASAATERQGARARRRATEALAEKRRKAGWVGWLLGRHKGPAVAPLS